MNLSQRLIVAVLAIMMAACASPPLTETFVYGKLAEELQKKTPAALRETRSRTGGTDINDPFRLTTVIDWCDLSKSKTGECEWKTSFNTFTYDPFHRAFLLSFTGGGFVGLTQLGGVTYAAKKAANGNCSSSALFCNGTMINVEGSQAASQSVSESSAASNQQQQVELGKKP